ncbi:MAG: hypothetical protein RSD55_07980, partial [Lachnospiraceae bacterium]
MSTHQITEQLKKDVTTLTPNIYEQVANATVEKMQQSEWDLFCKSGERQSTGKIVKFKNRMVYMSALLAACVAIIVGISMKQNLMMESMIIMDVNPSIEIQTNAKEKVLSVKALNTDAQEIIQGMNLKHTELNVTLNAIIGSMIKHGYLDDYKNTVLVSVGSKHEKREAELERSIKEQLEQILRQQSGEANVICQSFHEDQKLKELAQKYQISQGKALYIEKLLAEYPQLSVAELSNLTLNEIQDLIDGLNDGSSKENPSDIDSSKDQSDTDKDKDKKNDANTKDDNDDEDDDDDE